jgi:transcription initiation factor IIE alpha subunit
MTVQEVTRFDLLELNEVMITCKKCGAKMIFSIGNEACYMATHCCHCKEALGSYKHENYLRDLVNAITVLKESDKVKIEFELVK